MTEEDSYEKGMVGWREMKNVLGKGERNQLSELLCLSLLFLADKRDRQIFHFSQMREGKRRQENSSC